MDETNVTSLELPASYEFLSVVSTALDSLLERSDAITDRVTLTYNVQLAVQEICTNIVEHAYAGIADGRIELAFELLPRRLTIEIRDTGRSFDPDCVPCPNLGVAQMRGYGLFLVKALMDSVEYRAQADYNLWRLTKELV